MKLEFPLDNDRLSRILYVIAETGLQPEISMEFTVADPEAARAELLANAVRDSGFKAEVLAKAAGVKLGDIMNIDYSWGEVEMFVRPMEGMSAPLAAKRDSSSLDIEPDDITVEDTVTVVWSIA